MAMWHLIESVTLDKPSQGEPCNGCGLCCVAEVCDLGIALGDDQNCKALTRNADGSFSCGLVLAPYKFADEATLATWKAIDAQSGSNAGEQALGKMYAQMLGAGCGCDSDDAAVRDAMAEASRFRQLALPFPERVGNEF